MNGPVAPAGHTAGTSLGTGHADGRSRDGPSHGAGGGPAKTLPAAPAAPGPADDDPALRIAAQLLRLNIGDHIVGTVTRPDSRGHAQILTEHGLFALQVLRDGVRLPPGSQLRAEIVATGETLRVLIRVLGEPVGTSPQPAELVFLGSERMPAATGSRPLYAATLIPADGRARPLALHIGPAEAALPAGPATAAANAATTARVVARQALPDGTLGLTLATADGTMLVHDGPDLAPGSRVAIEIAARSGRAPPRAEPPVSLPSLAGFPAAGEAVEAVRRSFGELDARLDRGDPTLALSALVPGVAQSRAGPGHQVLAVMLLALGLRLRDLKGWLGADRTARLTEQAGPAPVLRAGGDFAEIARLSAEPSAQGWRPVVLPFHDGSGIAAVVLFHRDLHRDEDPAEPTPHKPARRGGSRLFLALELSHLGSVQIDGFAWDGRLDIVLRSRHALPETIRQALSDRYGALMAAAGLAGTLAYDQRDGRTALPQIGPIGPGGGDGGGMVSVTA